MRHLKCLFLCILIWLGCSRQGSQPLLTIAHEADLPTLDPIQATDHISISMLKNFYDGLSDYDADMNLIPALAVSWSNPDEHTWSFVLRKGVRFHDGSLLEGEDVRASIDRARLDSNSDLRERLSTIESVETPDSQHVRIRTRNPDPLLAHRLVSIFVAPRKPGSSLSLSPLGTGSYRFAGNQEGTLKAAAFKECWKGEPAVRRVNFVSVKPGMDTVDALESGRVDLLRWVPEDLSSRIESLPGLQVVQKESLRAVYLWMNSIETEGVRNPFVDRRVRQAVSAAIHRNELIQIMKGHGRALETLVPDWMVGYRKNKIPSFDPVRAKNLLAEAGYQNGFDITLTVAEGAESLGGSICNMLASVGIRAQMETLDWPLMKSRWQSGKLPVFIGSWRFTTGEPSFFLEDCLLTRQPGAAAGWNPGHSNPDLDLMIHDNMRNLSSTREEQLFRAIQMATESQALIPLFARSDLYGVSDRVQWVPRRDGNLLAAEVKFNTEFP